MAISVRAHHMSFPVRELERSRSFYEQVLGLETATLDFYDHRGDRLIEAVEERVSRGDILSR